MKLEEYKYKNEPEYKRLIRLYNEKIDDLEQELINQLVLVGVIKTWFDADDGKIYWHINGRPIHMGDDFKTIFG